MNTKEILKEEKQSKGPGMYQTTSYYTNFAPYSYMPNKGTSGLNPDKIADDTFLKGINLKNNRTIRGNANVMQPRIENISYTEGHVVVDTRTNKSCNDVFEKDYFKLGYRTNNAVVDAQKHINFDTRVGIDSRHTKR